jgi:agmatine deiminase
MIKKEVTIGLIQNKVSNDTSANLKKTEKMIRQAVKKGAQIICLQELFNIPYIPQKQGVDKNTYAESVNGTTTKSMQALSKKLKVTIVVPFYEKEKNGKYYNTAVVFNEQGKNIGKYHKTHIPHDPGFYEKDYFEHGQNGYKIFKTKYATFAVLICYDQWFPEAAREARLMGAEIIFYPTAIADIIGYKHPNDWHDAWETSMRGHAIANSVVVAAANRVGIEGKSKFWGQSFVCDPWGKILKRASKDKEQVVVQEVDLEYNNFLAEGWGFLRNRRPETYKIMRTEKLVKRGSKLQNVAHYKDEQKALGEKV